MKKVTNSEGLIQMSFILQAIALEGTEEEKADCACSICQAPEDLVIKYYPSAIGIRDETLKALAECSNLKNAFDAEE